MNSEPLFLTPLQVAERLGESFSESWVRRTARGTGVHSRGPNKKVVFSQEDFEALVDYIKNPPRTVSNYELET